MATNIRRHRQRCGLSVQGLVNRCATLGLAMERSNLAKLDLGQWTSMTVPELLVMARALEVPPLLLLTPAGSDEVVEILPGIEAHAQEAWAWIDDTPCQPPEVRKAKAPTLGRSFDYFAIISRLVDEWLARSRAAVIARGLAGDQEEPYRQARQDAAHGPTEAAEYAAVRLRGHPPVHHRERGPAIELARTSVSRSSARRVPAAPEETGERGAIPSGPHHAASSSGSRLSADCGLNGADARDDEGDSAAERFSHHLTGL
ncbi:hypothetical protein ABZ897_61060 [Nonomuraea sp. NPDC046802]|uniref:hypothetical protein n=1 Tax=Nonomuraea sp. NPDC046802 TaxID=3154919 RepID=UPI0033E82A52